MSTCDILEWDSAFFGRRIARFRGSRCTDDDTAAIMTECSNSGIDCVYILVNASDTESIAAVQRIGAYEADARVTLGADIRPAGAPPANRALFGWVRPANDHDIPALKEIAVVSHRDTRFYADKHFAVELCDRLYEVWIEKSCHGYADSVLVAEDEARRAAGYVTCHRDGREGGRIGLFAVREDSRGEGVGNRLLQAALQWFSENAVRSMNVATQRRNGRALRFYVRAGLLVRSVELVFHYWSGDVP